MSRVQKEYTSRAPASFSHTPSPIAPPVRCSRSAAASGSARWCREISTARPSPSSVAPEIAGTFKSGSFHASHHDFALPDHAIGHNADRIQALFRARAPEIPAAARRCRPKDRRAGGSTAKCRLRYGIISLRSRLFDATSAAAVVISCTHRLRHRKSLAARRNDQSIRDRQRQRQAQRKRRPLAPFGAHRQLPAHVTHSLLHRPHPTPRPAPRSAASRVEKPGCEISSSKSAESGSVCHDHSGAVAPAATTRPHRRRARRRSLQSIPTSPTVVARMRDGCFRRLAGCHSFLAASRCRARRSFAPGEAADLSGAPQGTCRSPFPGLYAERRIRLPVSRARSRTTNGSR